MSRAASRRSVLAGVAALSAAVPFGAAPALAMVAHPDAELLAHRTALLAAFAEHVDARAALKGVQNAGTPEYEAEVRVAQRLWGLIHDTFAVE